MLYAYALKPAYISLFCTINNRTAVRLLIVIENDC